MARIFIFILGIFFITTIAQGQQTVLGQFTAVIWADEFDVAGSNLWRQNTNADEIFIIQGGEYIMYRTNTKTYGLVFPNEKLEFTAHKAEFSIRLDDENSKAATGGVVIMAQEDGKGAFLVEINGKKQYRISKFNGSAFKPINDGWKRSKALNKNGENNVIALSIENKMYDLYINGEFTTSFSEVSYKSGKIGLYVGPDSKMSADYVRIYVTNEEKERIRKEKQKKQSEADNPVLTDVIKKLREQIIMLEEERDSLRVVVQQNEKGSGSSTPTPSQQKLKTENKELKAEIERLKKENAAVNKENEYLRRFKETIVNGQDGDIIINLTGAIETERQRVEALAEENEKLQEEVRKLRERLKN
jgi:hypothetical protein